ncbi:MAG TPA: hypothetical protein ENN22_06725 [bacterium]|nr:hypothetical protein [bacterium]
MPAGDGTGPMGMGPMTGRASGYCAGYGAPGYANPIPGRGYGFWGGGRGSFGRGRGHRHWYYATGQSFWARQAAYAPMPYAALQYGPAPYAPPMTPEQELTYLKDQAEYLATSLDEIQQRISELEGKARN